MAWSTSLVSDTLPAVQEKQFVKATRALSAALKRRRRELGLTQEDVADTLGIVARQYQKIESGDTNVTLRTLVRLAVALQTDLRDLL